MSHISYVNRQPPWPLWSPKALFASGAQGAWYDPSDLSTLFQDAAGTIPVTGPGQPVGLMRDKSGNGNHMQQSTALYRPTLQKDGSGYYHLEFDGTDDSIALESGTPATDLHMAIALYADDTQTVTISSKGLGGFTLNFNSGLAAPPWNINGSVLSPLDENALLQALYQHVRVCDLYPIAGSKFPKLALSGHPGFWMFKGRVYEFFWTARQLDNTEIIALRRWLALKAGVTL